MRPVKLTLRSLAASDAAEPGVAFPQSGATLVPAELAGVPVADALRASLAGAPGAAVPPTGLELALEFEVSGERFRAWRCWPAGGNGRGRKGDVLALLGRPTGDELTAMEVIAEGPERVAAELGRLAGAGASPGVVIAPWTRLSELIASGPDPASGVARGVFPVLAREIDPVARAMGGRIRELLVSAHDLLRQATERLAKEAADTLTPDDLVARREELAAELERASGSSRRLVDAAVQARMLVAETRRRKDLVDGYTRAEAELRKLDLRKNVIESDRRRLEKARRAGRLASALGLKPAAPAGPRVDPRVREQAEQALARAREEAGAARRALDAEEGRSREHAALAEWISRLEGLAPAIARLEESRASVDQVEQARAKAEQASTRARRELDSLQALVARLESERAVLASGPAHLDGLREELRVAERQRDDLKRLADVRERLRVEARELQQRKLDADRADEAVGAAEREMDYRARSPYAGARDEPAPDLRGLVARREELARVAAAQADVLASVREELRQLTNSLGALAYREPALLEAAAREKAEALGRWGQTGRTLAEVASELAEAGRRGVDLARLAEDLSAEAATRLAALQEARALVSEREAALPETLRSLEALDGALATARADLAARNQALERAREAARRAESIVTACEAGLRAAQDAERGNRDGERRGNELVRLRDEGFDSWEDFEESRLSEPERAQLEREVAAHDEAVAAAEQRVSLGQDQAALPRPDLPQVELLASLTEHARDEAQEASSRLAQEGALIDGWLDGLDSISSELSALEDSAGLGRRGDTRPGSSFEQRVHEALMRALLARAEGRLARWHAPWTLAWGEAEDEAVRHLLVRDAESDAPVALTGEGATLLALALALEAAAVVQERRRPRLETILLDGVPDGLDAAHVERVLAALAEHGRERPIAIPADDRAWELLAARLPGRA